MIEDSTKKIELLRAKTPLKKGKIVKVVNNLVQDYAGRGGGMDKQSQGDQVNLFNRDTTKCAVSNK